ncbi:cytochrome P460 family protein [Thermodesulfobacteriota bacterium]
MKSRIVLALVLMVGLTFMTTVAGSDENLPPADGAKLWTYITKTNSYLGWGFWPGYFGIYPGKSPHGAFLKIYANPIALQAAREGKPMPNGAIIVKENYGKDKKTLMAVTPMYRVKGYNPDGGDWYWGKYGPDGKIMAAGKPKGCLSCHGVQKSKDWLFTEPK